MLMVLGGFAILVGSMLSITFMLVILGVSTELWKQRRQDRDLYNYTVRSAGKSHELAVEAYKITEQRRAVRHGYWKLRSVVKKFARAHNATFDELVFRVPDWPAGPKGDFGWFIVSDLFVSEMADFFAGTVCGANPDHFLITDEHRAQWGMLRAKHDELYASYTALKDWSSALEKRVDNYRRVVKSGKPAVAVDAAMRSVDRSIVKALNVPVPPAPDMRHSADVNRAISSHLQNFND